MAAAAPISAESTLSVMIAAGEYTDFIGQDLINESVFVVNTPGPISREFTL